MYQGIYKIAGHNIGIASIYEKVHELCQDYKTNDKEEVLLKTTAEDILREQERSSADDIKAKRRIRRYSEGYLETLAIYRKMAEYLLQYNIVLFHGSVVAVDGEGYLFTAKSGTGKSTHTKLWMEMFDERAIMVNDDKPFLEITPTGIFAHGTPWDGKHHLSTNTSVPLKAICVLNRDKNNHIKRLDKREVYPLLLQQIYRPTEVVKLELTLKNLGRIIKQVKIYSLHCNMEPEAAKVAYEGMNED